MARLAYLQRVAYVRFTRDISGHQTDNGQGRSSHEHPPRDDPTVHRESSSAQARSRQGSGENAADDAKGDDEPVALYAEYVQRYNERGHPFNPESRAYGRAIRSAANDVLSVIGIVEKSDDADIDGR